MLLIQFSFYVCNKQLCFALSALMPVVQWLRNVGSKCVLQPNALAYTASTSANKHISQNQDLQCAHDCVILCFYVAPLQRTTASGIQVRSAALNLQVYTCSKLLHLHSYLLIKKLLISCCSTQKTRVLMLSCIDYLLLLFTTTVHLLVSSLYCVCRKPLCTTNCTSVNYS